MPQLFEWTPFFALVAGGLGAAILLVEYRQLRGTTLIGPWYWAAIALLSLVLVEAARHLLPEWRGASLYQLVAASATLCPFMALLGAKRPQHRGWHFVVVALWAILILPALESIALNPGQEPDIHGLRSGFLLVLILVGLLNCLPTRFCISGLVMAASQCVLLGDYLPFSFPLGHFGVDPPTTGLCGFVLSLAATAVTRRNTRRANKALDRLWLDFRDAYGLLWGLRFAERVNSSAEICDWNVRLRWKGFVTSDEAELIEIPEATAAMLRQNLEGLLRRFVSPSWIADRMARPLD